MAIDMYKNLGRDELIKILEVATRRMNTALQIISIPPDVMPSEQKVQEIYWVLQGKKSPPKESKISEAVKRSRTQRD